MDVGDKALDDELELSEAANVDVAYISICDGVDLDLAGAWPKAD